jgi:hypothetical protein
MLTYHTLTPLFRWILPCLAGAHDVFQHPAKLSIKDHNLWVKFFSFN